MIRSEANRRAQRRQGAFQVSRPPPGCPEVVLRVEQRGIEFDRAREFCQCLGDSFLAAEHEAELVVCDCAAGTRAHRTLVGGRCAGEIPAGFEQLAKHHQRIEPIRLGGQDFSNGVLRGFHPAGGRASRASLRRADAAPDDRVCASAPATASARHTQTQARRHDNTGRF